MNSLNIIQNNALKTISNQSFEPVYNVTKDIIYPLSKISIHIFMIFQTKKPWICRFPRWFFGAREPLKPWTGEPRRRRVQRVASFASRGRHGGSSMNSCCWKWGSSALVVPYRFTNKNGYSSLDIIYWHIYNIYIYDICYNIYIYTYLHIYNILIYIYSIYNI